MAKLSLPVSFPAEYRGREAAKTFTDRDTGEVVNVGEALKFERETMDGDAIPLVVRVRDDLLLGEGVDLGKLKKGDSLLIEGEVVLPEKFPGYFRVHALRQVGATNLRAAS